MLQVLATIYNGLAAMEPRPDGRGKLTQPLPAFDKHNPPQWSPGLMAGGSRVEGLWPHQRMALAAMEPRPDGRGKQRPRPQRPRRSPRRRNGAPA